jgi:hypothetical protein
MIVEHWNDDESTRIFPKGSFNVNLFKGTPVKCCEIVGESWEDCNRLFHEHMGWEPYVPFSFPFPKRAT